MSAMIYFKNDDKPMFLKDAYGGDSDEIAQYVAAGWKAGDTLVKIGTNDDGDGIFVNIMEIQIVTGPLKTGS